MTPLSSQCPCAIHRRPTQVGEKYRVLVAYHFFAHYRAAVLTELLTRSPHDYTLAASPTSIVPSIKVWQIPEHQRHRFIPLPCVTPHPRLLLQPGLLMLALRGDIDTIIFLGNAEWPCTWIAAIAARLTGKRVLFWTHGWKRRDHGIKKLFRNIFYRIPHALLLYGHRAKTIAIENGFPPDRLHVIYNSLDYNTQQAARDKVTDEKILEVRRKLFEKPDLPMVICTSRLSAGRKFDQLFEALRILKDQGHPTNLLLVGDGPEKQPLQDLATKLDLHVNFYGACYDESRLAELLMAANVCVAPGDVGLTAMHSMTFGVPVISHDNPDQQGPEWEAIIPGRTGDYFKHGDTADLARVVKRWTQDVLPPKEHRQACYDAIAQRYTPQFQQAAIDRAVSGAPADDLFWMKEGNTDPASIPPLESRPCPC